MKKACSLVVFQNFTLDAGKDSHSDSFKALSGLSHNSAEDAI